MNYENVFTGTAFVDRLLAKEPKKFPSREAAVRFAQELLREKHIQSIVKSRTFEDGSQLYYWREPEPAKPTKRTLRTAQPRKEVRKQGKVCLVFT